MNLHPKLKQINDIPYINSGGCAFVAIQLAEHIQTHHQQVAEVIYTLRKSDTERIRLANRTPVTCYHAYVKVGNTYIDSEGVYTNTKFNSILEDEDIIAIPISLDLAKASLKCNTWNKLFDRRRVRTLTKILKDR